MRGMTRYFRRYSRGLMLIFMSILLVVFLIGDSVQRGDKNRETNIKRGSAWGQPVMSRDVLAARSDFEVAHMLNIRVPIPSGDREEEGVLEFLALEEARRAGVRIDRQTVKNTLERLQVGGQQIDMVRKSRGLSLDGLYDTLGRVMAIQELLLLQFDGISESPPRLQRAFRDRRQSAEVKLSTIESRGFLSQAPEPSPEQLEQNFQQGRNRRDSAEADKLLFGYLQPPRVRVEYLTVDPNDILATVQVREREVRRFYDEHLDMYTRPVPQSQQTSMTPAREPMPYEQVRDRVREDTRRMAAIDEARRLVEALRAEARRPWEAGPPGAGGLREPPAADAQVAFDALAQRAAAQKVTRGQTDLVDSPTLAREPKIGRARMAQGNSSIGLPELAFRVEGVYTRQADDSRPTVRLNEPSPVLFIYEQLAPGKSLPAQALFFRVVEAQPEGPPPSLDVVRERVVANCKLLAAHELAGKYAEQLREAAAQVGLDAAVAQAADLKSILSAADAAPASQPASASAPATKYAEELLPFSPAAPLTRASGFIERVGISQGLVEKIFALAAADPAAGRRVTSAAIVTAPAAPKWVVAELVKLNPVYQQTFDQVRLTLARQESNQARREFIGDWLDAENLRQRAGFVPVARDQD